MNKRTNIQQTTSFHSAPKMKRALILAHHEHSRASNPLRHIVYRQQNENNEKKEKEKEEGRTAGLPGHGVRVG